LAPYRDLILSWLAETPTLKACQIWKRLKERGVAVAYRTTAKYTKTFREKKKGKIYWPLTFLPGEEAQVDWFFENHPVLGKLAGFILILSYSRYAFAHFFCRSSFEFFIEGHLMAFDCFGGTPRAFRYDNLKSVILKRDPLTYNAGFLEFARHYGFEIRLCNPGAGNEKGRVERLIRSVRETFLNVADHHQSLSALNHALHQWITEKNLTVHRATDAIPAEKKKEEKLKPLPERKWRNVMVYPPKLPTKTGFMIFDTNRYSVPEHAAGQSLALHVLVDRVDIFDEKGNRVANHPRLFERKKESFNPLHRTGSRLSEKAKRERIHAVICNMDPVIETFLEQNRRAGEDPYQSAYTFFRLLKDHSRGLLLSLVREALTGKICKMKFILSHLGVPPENGEPVSPQNLNLLNLDYQPRSLEDYDDNK
jgi:transposase